ncbi:zonadhesin-like isoform X9 [Epinephelus moara]|uniref:zonadhesin-like isoform X4 n=1 Tax=Epinephelus moara TaxID=300413 RepID=UPI00214F2601|nr:zonadhesin-like isoform X4 [Epinephelus moara]XP_049889143.1 zonadhesin-like isoform X5 [Epinephelus moara]XP_049889144.1 zonadhesin-like isoform X6 [Epinephelus moara]XP_049889145.1 zonadhesin-like isoform X7 [Epinephelus moara]XP_049889146.1 zonadhesin-like isoform X8 [Epinephelus moara]XP_049889147.1 zonadhesin-like isoform X9 [Epinephelus moara]
MLGGIRTDLLVTVTLLLLTQTGTQCRAEVDFSLVTLPDWSPNADYVSQCFYDRQNNFICDWTQWKSEDFVATILESGPLGLEGEACLEFWYISPVVTDGSELRVLLRSSAGLKEIWTLTALPRDSWRQVFVPLNVIEPGTQVVVEAVSTSGQFAFNLMGVRRGQCGPQCESNTELWTDESTRCLCSSGQLSCSPSQCPEGQICGPQTGSSRGISTSGTCTIHSHTDCSTFDGVLFRFMAPCTYTLAKTCSPSEALPMFSVEVVNEQNWNSSLPTVQQVVVNVGKFRVSLLRRQTHRVVVNGVWRKLPLSLSSGTINIKSNPAAVELETSFGLSVSFDNAGAVHVKLPSTYSDKVCGLCGNFNHLRRDDFRKPDGTNAQDATALAKSWQTEENTSSCETILVPHQCDPQEEAEYASELYCGGLLSSTGPFAGCLAVLGAESYFRGCVVDMCTAHGDPAALCETLQVYADICQEAGVAVPVWRNSTFCPLQCGENSHYNSCADGCPDVCSVLDIVGSCGGCDERCECDSGFKLSGGKCVPAEDCGCWYSGKHYEKGATFSEGECVQQCQCMGNNEVQCTRMQCANHEVCKVKDGVKGCFPFKPATCSVYGDPHYITFDGMAYDFQGGCSYTLTTTCGGQSSVQFTVIGHNMHPPIQNFTRSKLEAVTLKVEDLYLTLNQSGEVYVKNRPVLLPYFTNGTYGSVWVDLKKNYIVMETTFGLRITIDTQNRLFLQVDERYKYELCGLCGTYSDRQDDDFVAPEGQNATGPFEFGDSWRVPGDDECVSHPNDPRLCDYDQENEAYNECYTILGDAFKPCHESIHPSIYLNSCVYDYCATNGDRHTLCESLKSYAAACSVAGVELPHWQMDTACADPPTTATLPTSPAPTSPTPDQPFCPINCDFERNLCGWEQLVQDSFDWTRHSGPTPTSLTGPNQDHTTGAGYYMYIEGNSVTHGDSARLWSSNCHYNGPLCLNFWYHMYGSATAMALNIYLLKDKKATKLWSMRNNQGPEWHLGNADIRVSGPFQIIVEGIRGSTDQSDVAIDDISIHFGACSGTFPGLGGGTELPPITTEVLPSHSVCNMDCSFDSNLCSWDQMITDAFDWTWQSGSTPTLMTGPSADHTGDGHYLYIEASSVTYGDMSRLISPECSDSGPQCLQFWYHMYGSADTMGLHVYLLQNRSAHAVWRKRNDQGNMWHLAQVDITTTGAFQIIFEGRRGSNEESDVAIDDVKLYRGRCSNLSGVATNPPSVPVPTTAAPQPPLVNVTAQLPDTAPVNGPLPRSVCNMDCSFDSNLCSWDQMITDAFDWTWQSGSTPTLMTGPSADHTGDGHYLYIEASSVTYGDTSRLISPECSDSGPQCLQFWYHMYGSADTMGLHVYLLQNRFAHAVWRKRNDQGNMWHLAQVDITTTGAFQIIFEGRRGSNEESDVAIDDVKLYRGRCSDLSGGVATNPPSDPVPTTAAPQPPLVNVTALPPVANVTIPPAVEATTNVINDSNVTVAPADGKPPHPVCQLDCNFEQDLCQWSQLLTDVFDWTRHSGSTPTMMTGPSSDHTTGGGHYLYIEANSASYGDTSRLISSECSDSGPQCLQFWYHMYGSADTMGLHVYLLQNNLANAVWRKRNDQGNMWHLAQVDITTTGAFQIIFEGRIGSNDQSDVAIDDVSLHRGHCTDVAKPTKPAPSTFNPVVTEGPERPPANSPTAAQPQTATSSKPQRPSTTTATTTTTPTTTAATTNCDTQTPSRPATTTTPKTSNPNVPTTKPQLPITSTTTTTSGPHPPATEHPGAETSEQPEPEITARPQTTAAPEQPAISTNEPQTTAGPHPTTQYPGLETSEQPEPEITHGPQTTTEPEQPDTLSTDEPQTPAGPHPTTEHPGLETSEQPEPEITDGPQTTAEPEQPDTSSTDEPKTPAGPHPTTAHPGLETSEQPEPEITENPQMTTRPGQPATPNEPQTSGGPQPQTTESQEPTAGSQPPTTARPQPPTTARPQPPTTARPQPPTETQPQTTIKPQPPTTARPQPPTTARPQPPTTARPQPPTARPQPPTTPIPTPSCPANSHYTTCIPTCSPTCTYLNGPPRCSDDDGCVPGCVCDDGFVRRGRVCVPIQQCGCVDRNGTKHHFNEVWYTDHCRQKCECEKDDGVGEIDCDDDDECDGNAVCLQNEEGDYYCQSTGFGECIITRDPEYRTFDKMKHDFEGEHSYVLVRTNNLPNNLLHVYIEGINTAHDDDDSHHHDDSSSEEDHSRRVRDEDEDDDDDDDDDKQDDDSDENEEHHRLQELKIRVYDHTVEFKKHRRLMVSIRGIFNTTLPPSHFPLAPFQQTHYFVHGIISSYFLPTHRHL